MLKSFTLAHEWGHPARGKPFLSSISVPTLLISAADDPFLPDACYPHAEADANPYLFLDIPEHGGHVGFVTFDKHKEYWSESRAVEFVNG